jgi:hypothetical protein
VRLPADARLDLITPHNLQQAVCINLRLIFNIWAQKREIAALARSLLFA